MLQTNRVRKQIANKFYTKSNYSLKNDVDQIDKTCDVTKHWKLIKCFQCLNSNTVSQNAHNQQGRDAPKRVRLISAMCNRRIITENGTNENTS